ncbi:HEPN domain-containing protein [Thalassospira xiamenensis]|uniref:HEPN domain-containing protein n=1 Tax=Thalassospira xiamenensis TaxID=220697 RepID=UPI001FFEFB6F|nr:HEPN domain-containing protein [Thalassospira xiamenensis]MCK2168821.1 HEPN domain-containing protein [Thalassospira xiamenensis]
MKTSVFDVCGEIDVRVGRLQRLLDQAKVYEGDEDRREIYGVLCQSFCVLMAACLEGYLKALINSVISDLNHYLSGFSEVPLPIQREFCKKIVFFEKISEGDINKRINQLVDFFSENSVNIDWSKFSYKENSNKNPNGLFIDRSFEKIGVKSIVSSISIPVINVAFEDSLRDSYLLRRDFRKFRSNLYFFPYKKIKRQYGFVRVFNKDEKKSATLWHAFLENVMNRRHGIVHGDDMDVWYSTKDLGYDLLKISVFMYAITYSMTNCFNGYFSD